jgi:hypothetical protein
VTDDETETIVTDAGIEYDRTVSAAFSELHRAARQANADYQTAKVTARKRYEAELKKLEYTT